MAVNHVVQFHLDAAALHDRLAQRVYAPTLVKEHVRMADYHLGQANALLDMLDNPQPEPLPYLRLIAGGMAAQSAVRPLPVR